MYATRQLRDEHEGIKVMLNVLEHLAGELRQGRPVNTEDLGQILEFLRNFADRCHHGKEEALLFPALVEAGLPAQGGPVGVMLDEHTRGRAYIKGMTEALDRLRAGEDAGRDFADNAFGYIELLRAHIEKENQVLFVIAEQRLPEPEHARLAEAFDRLEREEIGEGVHEQYHALIHRLSERYLKRAA